MEDRLRAFGSGGMGSVIDVVSTRIVSSVISTSVLLGRASTERKKSRMYGAVEAAKGETFFSRRKPRNSFK